VTVCSPPRGPETEQDRDLERRVADLEALIVEARRRARRRRVGIVLALGVVAVGVAWLGGFFGGGGRGAGATALAGDSAASGQSSETTVPLGALPAGNGVSAFAFDPRRPNVVYMEIAHALTGVFVYKTTDDGQHWLRTGANGTGWVSDDLALTSDPDHPGTLYAGTDTAVYKTVDGGRSWQPFNQGLFPPPGNYCFPQRIGGPPPSCSKYPRFGTPGTTGWNRGNGWVNDVAVDPIDSNVVYAAAGDAVRKSTDGGHTWTTVFELPLSNRPPFFGGTVMRIAIAMTHPESIYAITDHGYTNKAPDTIYKSTDAGATWQGTGVDARLPSCCGEDALVVDPGNPDRVYADVGNTVFATTNGGTSWEPAGNGLPANDVASLAVDPRQPGTVYAGVTIDLNRVFTKDVTGGIYETTDGGQTWREIYTGVGIDKVAVDPARPSTIYAAGSARYNPNEARLLRSTDSGRTWAIATTSRVCPSPFNVGINAYPGHHRLLSRRLQLICSR
jgi:photosystem II stability/assembly factor-like uncharacterized protein